LNGTYFGHIIICILQRKFTNKAYSMSYKTVKGFSGLAQIGILFIFLGLGFVLAGLSQFLIGMNMVPADTATEAIPTALLKAMKQPENINTVRILQVTSTFFLM